VRTNYTLREGGNTFHGVVFGAYAPGKFQSDNLTSSLIARGLTEPNKIKANWDINPAFGGPILHDKIWFFGAARYNVTADYVAGLYWNKNTNNPNAWTYEPDKSRRVWNEQNSPTSKYASAGRRPRGIKLAAPTTTPATASVRPTRR
jgi:hypothetical protein